MPPASLLCFFPRVTDADIVYHLLFYALSLSHFQVAKHNVLAVLGSMDEAPAPEERQTGGAGCYISCVLLGRDGKYLGKYRKQRMTGGGRAGMCV